MGKEKIAHNKQFRLFPLCFILNQKILSPFVNIFDIISLFAAELVEPKIGMWGKGLKEFMKKKGEIGVSFLSHNDFIYSNIYQKVGITYN